MYFKNKKPKQIIETLLAAKDQKICLEDHLTKKKSEKLMNKLIEITRKNYSHKFKLLVDGKENKVIRYLSNSEVRLYKEPIKTLSGNVL